MNRPSVSIRLHPSGKTIQTVPDVPLLEALAEAGVVLDAPCGGEGLCGKCRVLVHEGAGLPAAAEKGFIAEADLQAGMRLACQTLVADSMKVEVPEASRLSAFHQILAATTIDVMVEPEAVVRKQYVELPIPGRGDAVSKVLEARVALVFICAQ